MTAIAFISITTLAAAVIAIIWQGQRDSKRTDKLLAVADQLATIRTERDEARGSLALRTFELETTRQALTAANIRAAALAKELTDALENPVLGAGLGAGDVSGRLSRIAEGWASAAAARDPLPADARAAVHPEPAAAGASAAGLLGGGPIDVLR